MKQRVYTAACQRGQHWQNISYAHPTRESAIEAAKQHYRVSPQEVPMDESWRRSPDLQFRLYQSCDGNGWNSTLMEIGPDDERPMMALAFYKIMEGYMGTDEDPPQS